MVGFHKVTIEMLIPDDVDHSDLLEQIQELALDLAEDHHDDEISRSVKTTLENECSVQDAPVTLGV